MLLTGFNQNHDSLEALFMSHVTSCSPSEGGFQIYINLWAKGCRMDIQISAFGWKDLTVEISLNAVTDEKHLKQHI